MIDLKMSNKEKKSQYSGKPVTHGDIPPYPWWTQLHLGTEDIKKMKVGGMEAGAMVCINAMAKVSEVRIQDAGKGNKVESMTIQIQKIEVIPQEDAHKKMRKEVAKEVWE